MVSQARRRNRRLIDDEKLVVRLGSVSELPFSDNSFEKAFSVNSFDLWENPIEDLKEVLRVLKKGGMLAVTVCPRKGDGRDSEEFGLRLQNLLSVVGFKEVRVLKVNFRPQNALCVAGVKPLYNGSVENDDPTSFEWMNWEVIYQRERQPVR
jgi:ubiquinone/menaquinone biosynthesis C-methylase UbiE